jgi:hypothetical protein
MIRPSSLILLILFVVSCSVAPNAITALPTPSLTALPTSTYILPAITPVPTLTSTPTATTISPGAGITRIIVLQATPPASFVGPSPTVARTATPLARTGWKTYVNANLHLAMDYPPDWTVRIQDTGAVFASPQGETIQLTPLDPRAIAPSDEIVQPNTRCSNTTNPHGINVRSCLATIGFSLDAYLDLKSAGGAETAAVISTQSHGAFEVVNALIESARIAP